VSSIDKDASGYYWLDRGDLDQEHCRVGDTGYYKCSYPSDFREKSLEVNINGNVIILIKHEDVVEQGQLQHVVHRLTYVAGDGDYLTATGRTYDTSKIVYDYKDYYRMQSEFDRQAQQHEKYRNMPKRELNEYYRRCFGKNASRYKQDGRCEDFYEVIMAGAYVEGAHYTLQ